MLDMVFGFGLIHGFGLATRGCSSLGCRRTVWLPAYWPSMSVLNLVRLQHLR
jgi:hypothetical protein